MTKNINKQKLDEMTETVNRLIELLELSEVSWASHHEITSPETLRDIKEKLKKQLKELNRWTEENGQKIEEKKKKLKEIEQQGKTIGEKQHHIGGFIKTLLIGFGIGVIGGATYHHIKKKKEQKQTKV